MTRVTNQAARAQFWHTWLCRNLPTELGARIASAAEHEGTLVICAASPAWSARLRYALHELEPQIRAAAPGLTSICVRVRPPV
jgi:hypothetical protein